MDWIGVGRAFAQVLKHKRATQGASTLTMQLAKITYNHRERNLHSKLTEVALAKRIEATYTKDEILETYINRIFWGHTFLGIAAAGILRQGTPGFIPGGMRHPGRHYLRPK